MGGIMHWCRWTSERTANVYIEGAPTDVSSPPWLLPLPPLPQDGRPSLPIFGGYDTFWPTSLLLAQGSGQVGSKRRRH
jgi:hypothetical protein